MRGPAPGIRFRRVFVPAAVGLAVAIVPLLVYNRVAFGSAVKLGYEGVSQAYPGMEVGFLGVSLPRAAVAWQLLFGKARGLLWFWPAFVLAPLSFATAARTPGFRLLAAVAGTVFIYYLCMNSGYYYWDGGHATGPRHLVAALPLLAPLVATLWDSHPRVLRPVIVVVCAVSFVATAAYVSIDMFAPDSIVVPNPWFQFFLPRLLDGRMGRSLLTHFAAVNGYLALVPLMLFWGLAWLFL
jgi:hypothetical protein